MKGKMKKNHWKIPIFRNFRELRPTNPLELCRSIQKENMPVLLRGWTLAVSNSANGLTCFFNRRAELSSIATIIFILIGFQSKKSFISAKTRM